MTKENDLVREYEALETAAERAAPGVLEMLKVVGGYEQAAAAAEAYLTPWDGDVVSTACSGTGSF